VRIAWFSPLVSSGRAAESSVYGSGVRSARVESNTQGNESVGAYASDLLLPHLNKKHQIELFHNRFDAPYSGLPTYHFLKAFERHAAAPFDLAFYNLEDRSESSFTRIHLGLMPGVVWFHSFLFSTFGPEPILNSPWADIVARVDEPNRPWKAVDFHHYQKGPLGVREGSLALLPIFSAERSAADFRNSVQRSLQARGDNGAEQRSWTVKVPALPKAFEVPARIPMGGRLIVGFCGSPRIEDRIRKLLWALKELPSVELHWLLQPDEVGAAQRLLTEYELPQVTLHTGRSPERWLELLGRVHCAVHTHFSAFGETSPYFENSLAAGRPAIVTRFGSADYLPDTVVFKVDPGIGEGHQIRSVLEKLRTGSTVALANRIREFAREEFTVERVASDLMIALERSLPQLQTASKQWQKLFQNARKELLSQAPRLLWMHDQDASEAEEHFQTVLAPTYREFGWIR
jgi:hypothetical protein